MTKMHYFSVIIFALSAAFVSKVCGAAPRDSLPYGDSIQGCFTHQRAQLDSSAQIIVDWAKNNQRAWCASAPTVYVCYKDNGELSVKCKTPWIQVPAKNNTKHKKNSKKLHHKH